jgi:hypothetical protein
VIQSTIVHSALSVAATADRDQRVRLTVDFSSESVGPDEVTHDIAEPTLDVPDAVDVDAAIAALVVEPAVADPMMAAGDTTPDIAQAGAAPDVSVRDPLAELPDAIPSDPTPRTAARTVSALPGRGPAGAIAAAANGMGMNNSGMNGTGAGAGGGIGGEMGRRLAAAGAQTGDVQISIAWNGIDDIDLHVQVEPLQGGMPSRISLDDQNGLLWRNAQRGRERIAAPAHADARGKRFLAKGMAPFGRYTIAVTNFRSWSGQGSTSVKVAVLVDGELRRFPPVAVAGRPLTLVHSFVRLPPAGTGGHAYGRR